MRPEHYKSKDLVRLLKRKLIVTIADMKRALGTESSATVFRKLKEVSHLTSYSHSGKYYALEERAEFDDLGLWWCREARFSRHGTLLATAELLVHEAEAGLYSKELETLLEVTVKAALLELVRKERLCREKVDGKHLYCAADSATRRKQVLSRKSFAIEASLATGIAHPTTTPDELKAAIVLFFSLLDEKQRRLYAGLESLKSGYGGDQRIAELLDLDVGTIAKGRHQLLEQDVELERVRRTGGGRKAVEKKRQK